MDSGDSPTAVSTIRRRIDELVRGAKTDRIARHVWKENGMETSEFELFCKKWAQSSCQTASQYFYFEIMYKYANEKYCQMTLDLFDGKIDLCAPTAGTEEPCSIPGRHVVPASTGYSRTFSSTSTYEQVVSKDGTCTSRASSSSHVTESGPAPLHRSSSGNRDVAKPCPDRWHSAPGSVESSAPYPSTVTAESSPGTTGSGRVLVVCDTQNKITLPKTHSGTSRLQDLPSPVSESPHQLKSQTSRSEFSSMSNATPGSHILNQQAQESQDNLSDGNGKGSNSWGLHQSATSLEESLMARSPIVSEDLTRGDYHGARPDSTSGTALQESTSRDHTGASHTSSQPAISSTRHSTAINPLLEARRDYPLFSTPYDRQASASAEDISLQNDYHELGEIVSRLKDLRKPVLSRTNAITLSPIAPMSSSPASQGPAATEDGLQASPQAIMQLRHDAVASNATSSQPVSPEQRYLDAGRLGSSYTKLPVPADDYATLVTHLELLMCRILGNVQGSSNRPAGIPLTLPTRSHMPTEQGSNTESHSSMSYARPVPGDGSPELRSNHTASTKRQVYNAPSGNDSASSQHESSDSAIGRDCSTESADSAVPSSEPGQHHRAYLYPSKFISRKGGSLLYLLKSEEPRSHCDTSDVVGMHSDIVVDIYERRGQDRVYLDTVENVYPVSNCCALEFDSPSLGYLPLSRECARIEFAPRHRDTSVSQKFEPVICKLESKKTKQ